MLNLRDIAKRITKPGMVNAQDLNTLKELSIKYPYTQLFSILYLKGLSISGDIHFDDELQKHSYRIGDRLQLYDLIKSHEGEYITPKEEAEDRSKNEEAPLGTAEKSSIEETKEKIDPIMEKSENQTQPVSEDQTKDQPNSAPEELKTNIIESSIESDDQKITSSEEKDSVEENILHHAFAVNYALEDLSDEEKIILEKRVEEKREERVIEKESISPTSDEKHTFTSWLSSDKNHTEETNRDKEAIDAIVNDFANFDPTEKLFGEVNKPKKEFFSPIKKAKESLREEGLPVSETLAKIYIIQGNYPKAIDAYTQLSLKYPEKKIFFANLIEDLKKKINAE